MYRCTHTRVYTCMCIYPTQSFTLSSYFVIYFFKLKLILFYNRVVYHYNEIFLILVPHMYCPIRVFPPFFRKPILFSNPPLQKNMFALLLCQ